MTVSHWDRLPDNIKGIVYQFDSTMKSKFNKVLEQLKEKFSKTKKVRGYHRYSPKQDLDYFIHYIQIPMRRKSKVTKYYIKRNSYLTLGEINIQPRAFNDRARMLEQKFNQANGKWNHLVLRYTQRILHFARCMKHNIPIYKRILN